MAVATALVFPGQGSQHLGMLEHVPENESLDRLLDAAEALADLPLCAIATDGEESDLADTRVAQPLLYLTDWAWGVALIESGVEPVAVAGHSLGELAALAIAGVFSVEAGLQLVVERSRMMAAATLTNPGSMAAVLGMGCDAVRDTIEGMPDVWVANDNSESQVVISGLGPAVTDACAALESAGARRVVPLNVSGAFHTPLMATACDSFAVLLEGTAFSDAAFPVYQNTCPVAETDGEVIRARLAKQIAAPVRWTDTMRALRADGINMLVEAGPGAVLAGLAKKMDGLAAFSAESAGIERILQEVS